MSALWLVFSILSEVAATLSLRASNGFRKKLWLIPVVAGYGLAFTFLGLALAAGMPVAVAYGIWTAVGIALIAVFARVVWKDPLTRRMILGIVLIIAGVVLVELG
ncbi:multidrug efflux SMR transporter [Leucobacter sp. BZR 635]